MTAPISQAAAEWWDAAGDRRLLVQRCTTCGVHQHYPRVHCTTCHSTDLEMVEAAGTGTLVSFSEVHRSPDPSRFTAPYTIAIVELTEQVRLLTRLVETPTPKIGMPVTVTWTTLNGQTLPVFRGQR